MPFLCIIAASALAHLWCLGSQFYLDDIPQIRDSAVVRDGELAGTGWLFWTTLWYHLQYRIFGMSAAGFHAVNWVLHTSVACVLFGFGRDFVRDRWPAGVALFGALLFAVHPLASEIPNYARTQDLAWVTLFSLLAAWAMLGFLRDGGWWKAVVCVVFMLGATFSKGPGLFHAIIAVGAVELAFLQPKHLRIFRQYPWQSAGVVALLLAAFWVVGGMSARLAMLDGRVDPRFIGHAYTLSRVFWEFAWRSVIPVALSSDHEITETLIPPGSSYWNIPDKARDVRRPPDSSRSRPSVWSSPGGNRRGCSASACSSTWRRSCSGCSIRSRNSCRNTGSIRACRGSASVRPSCWRRCGNRSSKPSRRASLR